MGFSFLSSLLSPEKRQRLLLGAFAILLLAGGGVFWYIYVQEDGIQLFGTNVLPSKNISVDLKTLDHPVLEELGAFPSQIPFPEQGRRQNPFILEVDFSDVVSDVVVESNP
jgi:hypothetical protein